MGKRKVLIGLISIAALILVAGAIYFLNGRFHFWADENQISETNLLLNPSFEETSNSSTPDHWSILPNSGGISRTASLDTQEVYEPSAANTRSLRLEWVKSAAGTSSLWSALVSDQISAGKDGYYEISGWFKSKHGNERLYFGIQELDADGKEIIFEKDSSTFNPVAAEGSFVNTDWQEYKGVAKIKNVNTRSIRVCVYAPTTASSDNSIWPADDPGIVWLDNLSVKRINFSSFGCSNSASSKCANFSNFNTSDSQLIDSSSDSIALPSSSFSEPKNDANDGSTYREILPSDNSAPNRNGYIKIPAFKVGDDGYATSNAIVEIAYQDTMNAEKYSLGSQAYSAQLYGKENLDTSDSNGYSRQSFAGLGEFGNLGWKTSQTLYFANSYRPLKAIDGYFWIRIKMPQNSYFPDTDSDFKKSSLPIKYVSINFIDDAETENFMAFQRRSRGLTEAKIPADGQEINQDFYWFSDSCERQIFSDSLPNSESATDEIKINAFLSEKKSACFSLRAKQNVNNLKIDLSDLIGAKDVISKDNIHLEEEVYNYHYWDDYTEGSTYGYQPDYFQNFQTTQLKASSSFPLTLTVDVADNLAGGIYTGQIIVSGGQVEKITIPIKFEVLPTKLLSSDTIKFIYSNPYAEAMIPASVDKTMVEAASSSGFDTLVTPVPSFSPKLVSGLIEFDLGSFRERFDQTMTAGGFNKYAAYTSLYSSANEIIAALNLNGTLWDNLSNPDFIIAFNNLISQIDSYSKNNGAELLLSVNDEPGTNLKRRVYADRLYPLIRQAGIKTWSTYYPECNLPLACSDSSICGSNTLSSLSSLIDYKLYAMRYLSESNVSSSPNSFAYYTTYYSQLRNPVINRFLNGFYAWKTDAKVVANYTLFWPTAEPTYNEFDTDGVAVFPTSAPDYSMTNILNKNQSLAETTSLRSAAAGNRDRKMIGTLENLIAQNANSQIAILAQDFLNDLETKISKDFNTSYAANKDEFGVFHAITKSLSDHNNETDYKVFDQAELSIYNYIKQLIPVTPPSFVSSFNLTDNQVITTNPYMLSVKVKDPSKVSKVEYYIDNILIGTATLPDVNGVYDWPWDTSKYHSTVKIVVYGTDGTTEEVIRNTTVQLSSGNETNGGNGNSIVSVLPKTGEEAWWKRISEYCKKIF